MAKPDTIQLNIQQLMVLSKKYEKEVPFKQFYATYQGDLILPETEIIKNIDNKIKSILQNVIDNFLDLDIAFIQIHKLIMYATEDVEGLYPKSFQRNYATAYYKLLMHFIIFGCCLGTRYTKYIVLDENDVDYQNSAILRYCINGFLPQVTSKHINYQQCNQARDPITNELNKYFHHDISGLIADFVDYKFDEFFVTLSVFFKSCEESQRKTRILLRRLWRWYGFTPGKATYFIPKLLLTKAFISIPDDDKLKGNLEYFADTVFLQSLSTKHATHYQFMSFWRWFLLLASN
eukprot:UN00944